MNERLIKLAKTINDGYKKPMVMAASEVPNIFRISTGNPAINHCMTGGGTPVNRIIEIYGPESSGKTFTADKIGASFQKMEWRTRTPNGILGCTYKERIIKLKDDPDATAKLYVVDKIQSTVRLPRMKAVVKVDVEGTYLPDWGTRIGLDNKLLVHVIPETAEQAVDITVAYLMDPDVSCVIFDSVAVARAAAEIEKSMEEQTMGQQARFWNRAAAKFQAAMNNNPEQDVTLVLINRSYQKIGLVFGDPEEVGSGSGLKYAKSISLKLHPMKILRAEVDGIKDVIIGRTIEVQNKKNKTGPPYRTAQYFFNMIEDPDKGLHYGDIDIAQCLVELGIQNNLIERSGSNYKFGRIKVNGRDKFEEYIREHPSFAAALEQKIYEL